jgi:uncharacterized membrane protein YhhN
LNIFEKTGAMLTKSEKTFSIIFAIILLGELICDNIESLNSWHYLTKPLLLLSLIIFFLKQQNNLNTKSKSLTLAALLFSLLGDVFLMFTNISSNYFIGGLLAFLLAHIMYILVFLKERNTHKISSFLMLFLLVYGVGIFYFLKDGLGELLVPVIVYMLVILTMVITAFLRHESVSKMSYNLVFLGAIFFVTSDSLLALNKFYKPFETAGILVMLTYAIAQYLIILGLKKQQ